MKFHPAAWLSTACAAALLSGAARAQTEDARTEEPAPAGPENAAEAGAASASGIDEITIYGTRNPISVFDYPGMVTVYSRERVETLAPSTISDLLAETPGLQFFGGPRRTGELPALRGLSGDNVLILLDGARQNFLSAHDGRFFLDPELIKTAEVVRGPASSLYGSGAVGGVLAFETVDAGDFLKDGESYGGRVRLGYQGVNEESLATVTGFARQGALDLVASAGYRDSGDIELGSGDTLPADDDITTGLVKGSLALSGAVTGELSWQGFRNEAFEPNNGQGGSVGSPATPNVEKDIQSDLYRGALAIDPASELIDATLTLYRADTSVEEYDASLDRTTLKEVETTGARAENSLGFDLGPAESILTFGGDWYRDEQTGTDTESADGTRAGVPNAESEFFGAFVQLETALDRPLGLPGELIVVPGARYDRYENQANIAEAGNEAEEISPRLAASYGPVDWFRVFGSYSEGFRAPSVDELYLSGVHFSLPHPVLGAPVFISNNFIPNPDLKPEVSATTEFGAGVNFRSIALQGDQFQAKISAYRTEAEDLINLSVNFAFPPSCFAPPFFPCSAGTTESSNVANAELTGWEGEARYEAERVGVRFNISDVDGENEATGEKLGVLTPLRAFVDAQYRWLEADMIFGVRAEFADAFDKVNDPAEIRDGYAVAGLYASWAPEAVDGLRIDAGVDNIFDTDYERVFAGVSEPGRNARIAVSYRHAF